LKLWYYKAYNILKKKFFFPIFVGVILQVTKKNRVAPRVLFRDVLTNEDLRKEPAGSEGKQLLRCLHAAAAAASTTAR
jgi:hypothetical protein